MLPQKTLLDFKTGSNARKTTMFFPPTLGNRDHLTSALVFKSHEFDEDQRISNDTNKVPFPEGFLDFHLQANYHESIGQINNYDWLLDPLTTDSEADDMDAFTPNRPSSSGFGSKVPLSLPAESTSSSTSGTKESGFDYFKFECNLKLQPFPGTSKLQASSNNPKSKWEYLMTKPAGEQAMTVNPLPTIYVYSARVVNFVNVHIQFGITAFNIPAEVKLTSKLLEAVVETPSGVRLPCLIANDKSYNRPSWSPRSTDSFQGGFLANEEIGPYKLQVRLLLPMSKCYQSLGVIGDETTILVSRNYFRESQKPLAAVNGLQFGWNEKMKTNARGKPGLSAQSWGIACDKISNRIYYTCVGTNVACLDPETGKTLFHFDQSEYTFNRPMGIAVDHIHRRVLVCDTDNHKLCYFSRDGRFLGAFGGQGTVNGMFNFPWDVDVSPLGTHVAVSDSRNQRIQLFDSFGNYIDKFSVPKANPFVYKSCMDYPLGIAFGHDGHLIYVTDFHNHKMLEIPLCMTRSQRHAFEGQLNGPQGIAVDKVGSILLADTRNNCIHHMAFDGSLLSTIRFVGGAILESPVSLTVMQSGQVAVMDMHGRIWCF